jgi:alginate O-acetyltransferase complex protein AlgJ
LRSARIILHKSVAILFVAAISLPMIVGVMQADLEISPTEKRVLAQWPQWAEEKDLKTFLSTLSSYVADQFGFRQYLISVNKKLKWFLGYSPSASVVRGEDDWLFLKIQDPLLTQHKYGEREVENRLIKRANYVRDMEMEMAKRGIAYQHITASNKMTVYKQYLPTKFSLTNITASYEFYQSQFTEEELSQQVFSDRVLSLHKQEYKDQFYFKNDTHWNHLGAYLVFSESIARLRRKHPELEFDSPDKTFLVKQKHSGDLAGYLGLGNKLVATEPQTNFRVCARRKATTAERQGVNQSVCERNRTIVLMIGDSFMANLMPFYSESIGKMYSVGQTISRQRLLKLVDEFNPDLVIEELAERHLPGLVPL